MIFSPALHGTLGVWDEIIFAGGFVISVIIFIALALSDKKRNSKDETQNEDDDD